MDKYTKSIHKCVIIIKKGGIEMKKSYNLFSLYTVSKQYSYHEFICERKYDLKGNIYYKEIFTNTPIKEPNLNVEPLMNYYAPAVYMHTCIYMLNRKQLLDKYWEINECNFYLNNTDEDTKEYLNSHGLYKESKLYKKENNIKL